MHLKSLTSVVVLLASVASCQTIARINGNRFLSPLDGQNVTDVRGVVTAKGPDGFWIRSPNYNNGHLGSQSVYVYGDNNLDSVAVGNLISLNGRVDEYRSNSDYLYITEILDATDISVLQDERPVNPLVLGQGKLTPPTETYTNLDDGDVFGIPNDASQVSEVNPVLKPKRYGLDFWESLAGELVTVRDARAISKPNQYGDTWVVGSWQTSGENDRGGLTITDGDANPEGVIILSPLDGTDHPQDTKLGDSLEDITGIVQYAFGNYGIYPMTALSVTSSQQPALPPPTSLRSSRDCSGVTFGQYNVENLDPDSGTFDAIAEQIVDYLRSPDILFLQEIQDNNGATDDGTVSANETLSMLVSAIASAGSTANYSYVDIPPVNDAEGGEPGGNIRNAYLYNADNIQLRNPNPGSSTEATEVLPGPELSLNPGRIDPGNSAWENSRVPLAAAWEIVGSGDVFFTVNVHWTSKGGSSSLFGDPRPPVNGGVDQREAQAQATASFIADILAEDANAAVISAGDYNEFAFVGPMETFVDVSGLEDLDEVAGIPVLERYTYVFGQNSQQLDHMHISPRLAEGDVGFEHIHVSSWVSYDDQVSDHDPSVARLDVCQ